MAIDESIPIPSATEDVFGIGERTIYNLRNRPHLELDDLGTMVARPHPLTIRKEEVDPIERLEDKIDVLTRMVDSLQRTVDVLLARANAPSR